MSVSRFAFIYCLKTDILQGTTLVIKTLLEVRGTITGGSLLVGTNSSSATTFNVYGTIEKMKSVIAFADDILVNTNSIVSVSGTSVEEGYVSYNGAGASHGGSGGTGTGQFTNVPYGSYYHPSLPGLRGEAFKTGSDICMNKLWFLMRNILNTL